MTSVWADAALDRNLGRLTGAGPLRLARGGDRVVVIGAGGWLGLATLELLHRLLGPADFADRVVAFGSAARRLFLRGGLVVDQRPITDLAALPPRPSLVLHLAFLTREKADQMTEAQYVEANRAISGAVWPWLDAIGTRAVFLPSSGAIYRVDDPTASPSVRLYGRLKLEDEKACFDWANDRRANAAIVRVFNLAGPYINKVKSYALASFILDALSGRPIAIHARNRVYRSYVATSELMSAVLGVMTDESGSIRAFDTVGEACLEVGELAQAVVRVLGAEAGVLRPPISEEAEDRYVGSVETYRAALEAGGVTQVPLEAQIAETAAFLADPTLAGADRR